MRARDRERRLGRLLATPAVALVVGLAGVPVAAMLALSLRRHVPVFDVSRFVGLENWAFLARDPRFVGALGNTAYVTVVSVALELALGLAVALLLDAPLRARGALRAATLLPWTLPTVVGAWLWEWILDPGAGLLGYLTGLETSWLADPDLALHAVIVADVWKSTPFAALLLLAGLQLVPPELREAARVDGAGPWRRLVHVVLPVLAPTLVTVALFRTLDAFRIFDVVFVLTGGGPADTTETLSVYAYELSFQTLQLGYGSTVAAASFLAMLVLAVAFAALQARAEAL